MYNNEGVLNVQKVYVCFIKLIYIFITYECVFYNSCTRA